MRKHRKTVRLEAGAVDDRDPAPAVTYQAEPLHSSTQSVDRYAVPAQRVSGAAALDDVEQYDHDRNDQQDVDQAAHRVGRQEAKAPALSPAEPNRT